jgi:pyruvate carboxylase subunit B
VKYVINVGSQEVEIAIDGDRVTVAERTHQVTVGVIPGTPLRQLLLDNRPFTFAIESLGRGRWALTQQGERWEVEVLDERTRHIRGLAVGANQHRSADVLKAPMPGLVVRIQVNPGDRVKAGTGVVVLEAMKMENELKASAPGVVKSVRIAAGEAVEKGQVLVEFDEPSPP